MNTYPRLRSSPVGAALPALGTALVLVLGLAACTERSTSRPLQEGARAPEAAETAALEPGPPSSEDTATPEVAPASTPATVRPGEWLSLFDGETLEGWKVTEEDDFSPHGEVQVSGGSVVLGEGGPYTGITWTGDFPKEDFEVALEAKRLSGCDIFCGVTVPVGKANITLVLGGWGDSIVGLSNVDHWNASENETTKVMSFENNRWFSVRLRVTAARIEAWIDGEQVVEQEREGHTFTIYDQLYPIAPFGFFSWQTEAALRNIEMKRLGP